MKKTSMILAGLLVLGLAAAAGAQPYPVNGYIGLYEDAAGTDCCVNAPVFAATTAHVIAHLAGASANGITQAEFRLEFSTTAGYSAFVWGVNPLAAGASLGNPIDSDPVDDANAAGANVVFPTCQAENGSATFVELGTIQIFNFVAPGGSPVVVKTKMKTPPSNPTKRAPLYVLCDAPDYTAVVLTLTADELGEEPVNFISTINPPTCAPTTCGVVAVEPTTWGTVKGLFR